MPTDLRDTVATEIRVELVRRRMSQTTLAGLLGEQQWWVSKRLTRSIPFTLEDLDRIAKVLGLPPTHFMQQQRAS